MSTSELTPPIPVTETQAHPRTAASPRGLVLSFEHLAYLGIAVLAIIVHMWGLGDRALHHDETLHAAYSWFIYVGRGYIHDPLLHGPFLYYFGALLYFLFGDNDFTARLGAALFGTVLTLLPFLVRRELGRPAALMASVYLLIAPTFLYVGRFFRHDMYSIVFEMLVFVAIVRYASTRRAGWLLLGAAAFALMYTNQETSYLFLLIMLTPLVLLMLWRVYKPGIAIIGALGMALASLVFVLPGEAEVTAGHTAVRDDNGAMVVAEYGPLFGWGPLATEDNAYALNIRNRPDDLGGNNLITNLGGYLADLWLFFSHPAILTGIGLLLACSALLVWLIWLRRGPDGLTPWQRALQRGDPIVPVYDSLMQERRWLWALGIFLAIYALLFTAFFTNLIGLVSGTTGSLLYWLAQHNVERGGQPPYYYLVLLGIYEPLLVLFGSAGLGLLAYRLGRGLRQRTGPAADDALLLANLVPLLLAWWSLMALGIYSWAGEKMPWLLVHVALPLVLLSAWAVQELARRAFRERPLSETYRPLLLFVGGFVTIVALAFVRLTTYFGDAVNVPLTPPLILGLSLALVGLLVAAGALLQHWRWALGALLVSVALAGSFYNVRNAYRLNFELGDVPREMLIYTQTSPDVMHVVRDLEAISRLRTDGLDMPIIYDNETVWQWYLRDFTNATNNGGTLSGPPAEEVQAVLMLYENVNRNPETLNHLAGFRIQRYPLRWWFPESSIYHKGEDWREVPLDNASLLTRAMRAPFDEETTARLWAFLLHRDPGAPLGSTDFILAVRPELADQIAPGIGAEDRR